MRIALTGADGRLGSATILALRARDHEVIGIDTRPIATGGVRRIQADLRDLGQTYGALAGADAVIHLAAIPSPTGQPPEVVFTTNITSTFNVFEAAATLGIRRVVYASSVSALGFPWQHQWSEPLYLPIDEEHPLLPQDCYGLSKATGEEIAAAYARRGAGSALSLRFSTILSEEAYESMTAGARRDPGSQAHLLWASVDLRDAANACVLAVEATLQGHQPLYVTADDTTADLPTEELLDRFFPRVPRRPGERPARWSLLDISRARVAIGYQPRYHGRQEILPPGSE